MKTDIIASAPPGYGRTSEDLLVYRRNARLSEVHFGNGARSEYPVEVAIQLSERPPGAQSGYYRFLQTRAKLGLDLPHEGFTLALSEAEIRSFPSSVLPSLLPAFPAGLLLQLGAPAKSFPRRLPLVHPVSANGSRDWQRILEAHRRERVGVEHA